MRKSLWWKLLAFFLLVYTIVRGFLGHVPRLPILNETIRNVYFHASMWLAMMALFIASFVYSIKYLRTYSLKADIKATQFASVGCYFGILAYLTGFLWVSVTWITQPGESVASVMREPKLIGAAIALLTYAAYFVLRSSITDIDKRAKIAAVFNIFAFAMLFPSIWIVPRLMDSLHPGSMNGQGNPILSRKDMDYEMRIIFWPAVMGWSLVGIWLAQLKIRINLLKENQLLND